MTKALDKLLLISTGLAIFVIGFPLYIVLQKIFTEKWTIFILESLGYWTLLLYLTFTYKKFKRYSKNKLILFQSALVFLTVGIAFLVFRFELLPMPDKVAVYFIPMILLSGGSMVLLEYCVRNLKFFRNNKKNNEVGR